MRRSMIPRRQLLLGLPAAAFALLSVTALTANAAEPAEGKAPVRVGIVGFDNYQALAFTQLWHKPFDDNPDLAGLKVVAAWPGGSDDIEETRVDIERWRPRLLELGVSIEGSIQAVLARVDAVIMMTIDGRKHRAQAEQVLKAGKRLYIGRPLAGSLEDVIAIFDLSEKYNTPLFSCSQHRYSPGFIGMRNHPEVGEVTGVSVYGGCPSVPHHAEFFWHSVHSFDTLYTIMGPGVVTVTRASTPDAELVTCVWKDGRIGTFRGIRKGAIRYSATVFGEKGVAKAGKYGYPAAVKGVVPKSRYKGYEGVATEIAKFFKGGENPIPPAETIELFATMEAAHESARRGGVPVKVADILAATRKKLAAETASAGN